MSVGTRLGVTTCCKQDIFWSNCALDISERQGSVNSKQKDVKFLEEPAAGVDGCEARDRMLSDISYTLTPPVHSEKELRVLPEAQHTQRKCKILFHSLWEDLF